MTKNISNSSTIKSKWPKNLLVLIVYMVESEGEYWAKMYSLEYDEVCEGEYDDPHRDLGVESDW